jgi:hypothetical protein
MDHQWGETQSLLLSTEKKKTVSGMASSNFSSDIRSLRLLLQQGSHGNCLFGSRRDDFGRYYTVCTNHLTQICTFKLLKPCRSVSGESDLTKILLKSSFNMTTHNHT